MILFNISRNAGVLVNIKTNEYLIVLRLKKRKKNGWTSYGTRVGNAAGWI